MLVAEPLVSVHPVSAKFAEKFVPVA